MKGAGATYKTYVNTQIRKGKFDLSYKKYLSYFDDYWKKKVVDKVKMEKTKEMKRKMGDNLRRELMRCKSFYRCIMYFSNTISCCKRYCNKRFKQGKIYRNICKNRQRIKDCKSRRICCN